MTFNIRPAGAALQFPYYERAQPKDGVAQGILRALGLVRTNRRVRRTGELACPFEFAVVPGAEAEQALDEISGLRADGTPVILGEPETAADMLTTYRTLLDSSPSVQDQADADRWLAERQTEFKELEMEPPRGPWPTDPRPVTRELTSVRGFRGNRDFFPEIVVALVPTTDPTSLAPNLRYGDWNDCPSPAVHAAMARRWSQAYGATPVVFAEDVVEYRVARPVGTQEQAIELALEQYAYCPDIVLQGTETVERLAAEILGARYWFFWWD